MEEIRTNKIHHHLHLRRSAPAVRLFGRHQCRSAIHAGRSSGWLGGGRLSVRWAGERISSGRDRRAKVLAGVAVAIARVLGEASGRYVARTDLKTI